MVTSSSNAALFQRVLDSFSRQGLMNHLGATLHAVEFKINLLAPAQGSYLEATGKVLRSGRTLTVCQVDVCAIQGAESMPVAVVQQTLICINERPAGGS